MVHSICLVRDFKVCMYVYFLDPERAQEKLEAMEASRRRMQEKFDAEAARYAEQQKIVCPK